MNFKKANRKIHYWGAIASSIPVLIIILSGILLLLKKEIQWVQPSTIKGQSKHPSISFETIINNLQTVDSISLSKWEQIKRIDIRPNKGMMKIQLKNSLLEIQMDQQTGEILQVATRRSDLIESIHDGSFFHDSIKLWLFLPAAIVLFLLWITGIYLFVITELSKHRSRVKQKAPVKY